MTSMPPYTRSTAASAVAAVTPGPASREPSTNTSSGSARGWIKEGTGTPAGSTIASVSQASSGESMPIRCCFARDVRPSFSPTSVSPRARRSRRASSWIAYAVSTSRSGQSEESGARSETVPSREAAASRTFMIPPKQERRPR